MDSLLHLSIIWAGVFVAVVLAKRARLTPVLYFLFIRAALTNIGLLQISPGAWRIATPPQSSQ